jgi:hypothetical protein
MSSDPAAGAKNISVDGSTFTVSFPNGIKVPQHSNPTVAVLSANYWFSFVNVKADATLWISNTMAAGSDLPIIFVKGLYSIKELNESINLQCLALGKGSGVVEVKGESATGRLAMVFKVDGWRLRMDDPSFAPLRDIMGFTAAQDYQPWGYDLSSLPALSTVMAANRATMNQVSEVLINTDLIASSNTMLNSQSSMAICAIAPMVDVGSQRLYEPSIPVPIDCPGLDGANISQATMWLTSQDGYTRLDTAGENWSVDLVLAFDAE